MPKVILFTDFGDVEYMRPIGAYQVASRLRAIGYSTQVIDHFTFLSFEQILAALDKFIEPDTLMIGFSSTFMVNNHEIDDMIKMKYRKKVHFSNRGIPLSDEQWDILKSRVRSVSPKIKFVKGGSNSNFMADKHIDAFIHGYADKMIIDYVRYLDGKNPFFTYRYRKEPNEHQIVIDNDVKGEGFDFTNTKFEWAPQDLIQPHETLPIEIARGCIFRCKFCSYPLNGKKKLDFIKRPEIIRDEMLRNYEQYGVTQYAFMDDTYNDSVEKIEKLGNMFSKLPFKLKFVTYLRHDLIWANKQMADILLESGLVGAQFGIETLNYTAGKTIGKGLHPDKTMELLYWLRDEKWGNNVILNSNFILGLPNDSAADIINWTNKLLDPNFPLHSWSAKAFMLLHRSDKNLAMQKIKRELLISDIALNYKQYGYEFPNVETLKGRYNWVNSSMGTSYDSMFELEQTLLKLKKPMFTTCWGIMQLQQLGYSYDELTTKPFTDTLLELYARRMMFVNKYYDQLMRL
jgi:hypothetical protein